MSVIQLSTPSIAVEDLKICSSSFPNKPKRMIREGWTNVQQLSVVVPAGESRKGIVHLAAIHSVSADLSRRPIGAFLHNLKEKTKSGMSCFQAALGDMDSDMHMVVVGCSGKAEWSSHDRATALSPNCFYAFFHLHDAAAGPAGPQRIRLPGIQKISVR